MARKRRLLRSFFRFWPAIGLSLLGDSDSCFLGTAHGLRLAHGIRFCCSLRVLRMTGEFPLLPAPVLQPFLDELCSKVLASIFWNSSPDETTFHAGKSSVFPHTQNNADPDFLWKKERDDGAFSRHHRRHINLVA